MTRAPPLVFVIMQKVGTEPVASYQIRA